MGSSRREGHNANPQFLVQPNIEVDNDVRHWVVDTLTHTLAFETLLTQKTRGAAWFGVLEIIVNQNASKFHEDLTTLVNDGVLN